MKKIIILLNIVFNCAVVQSQSNSADRTLVSEFAKDAILQIKISELAGTNALTTEVKDLSTTLITELSQSNEQLKSVCEKNGIPYTAIPVSEQQKTYKKMLASKGEKFDQKYIRYVTKQQVTMKRRLSKQIKHGQNMELKTWAQNMLPNIQHHQNSINAATKSIHQ